MISDNLNLLIFAHHLDDEKAAVSLTDTRSNGVTQRREMTVVSESGVREREPSLRMTRFCSVVRMWQGRWGMLIVEKRLPTILKPV